MYTTKTDRCSRRFGRRFSSGASRRTRAIFFFNAGSDRRLRTSLSRGYCWGLDLRIDSRRSIPSSEMLRNSFAGLQRRKASTPEGRRSLARSPQARELTFGGRRMQLLARKHKPGEQDLRNNQGGHLRIRWSRLITQKWPGAYEGPRRPKVIKHQDEIRRRTQKHSSGIGVRVKREYVRRSDLYTLTL